MTSGSMGSPWAFCHGAEITTDIPMCVLVTVEVPLRGLAGAAALKIASIRESVSVDVTAVKETSAFMSFVLPILKTRKAVAYRSNALVFRCSGQWGHRNSDAIGAGTSRLISPPSTSSAGFECAAVFWLADTEEGVKATVDGLVSFVAPAGVEKADHELSGVELMELTFDIETSVFCAERELGEASVSNGTPSSP